MAQVIFDYLVKCSININMEISSSEQHERDVSALRTVTILGLNGTAVEKRLIEESAADMTNAYVGLFAKAFAAGSVSYEPPENTFVERVEFVERYDVTPFPVHMLNQTADIKGDLSL